MSDHTVPDHPDRPLRLVGAPEDDTDATARADTDEPGHRDPLLERAECIADLPLAERPAAFDGLNRAVVAELNLLDEG